MEENLPQIWVNDFLIPPFRDAAPQGAAPGGADDTMQMEDGSFDPYAQEAGAYWDPTVGCSEEVMLAMASALGICPDAAEPDELQYGRACGHRVAHTDELGYPASLLPPGVSRYDEQSLRWLSSPSPCKLSSPRTHSDDGDTTDDASTSAGGTFLAAAGTLLSQAASRSTAGAIRTTGAIGSGAGASTTASSANSSPWMIPSKQEPTWGPFAGGFMGVPVDAPAGLFNASAFHPMEPAILMPLVMPLP